MSTLPNGCMCACVMCVLACDDFIHPISILHDFIPPSNFVYPRLLETFTIPSCVKFQKFQTQFQLNLGVRTNHYVLCVRVPVNISISCSILFCLFLRGCHTYSIT